MHRLLVSIFMFALTIGPFAQGLTLKLPMKEGSLRFAIIGDAQPNLGVLFILSAIRHWPNLWPIYRQFPIPHILGDFGMLAGYFPGPITSSKQFLKLSI